MSDSDEDDGEGGGTPVTPTDPNAPENWPVDGGVLTVPGAVKDIDKGTMEEAMNGKNVTEVNLGQTSITEIPSATFQNCKNLEKVTLPSSVTKVDAHTFEGCTNLDWVGTLSDLESIGMNAFKGTALTGVDMRSDKLTSLGNGAFSECDELETVNLGACDGLTSIGIKAFYGCSSLSRVTLPSKLTEVQDSAFEDCVVLSKLDLSNNEILKSGDTFTIGVNAFKTTAEKSLTLSLPNEATAENLTIGSHAFENRTVTLNYNGSDRTNIVAELEHAGATKVN